MNSLAHSKSSNNCFCLALKFFKIDHSDSTHSSQESVRMWINENTFIASRCCTDDNQIYKDIGLKTMSVPSTGNPSELVMSDRYSHTCTNTKLTETKLQVQTWLDSSFCPQRKISRCGKWESQGGDDFFSGQGQIRQGHILGHPGNAPVIWDQAERVRMSFSRFLNCTLFSQTFGRLQVKFTVALL